jgi:hypothetical protein
MGHFSPDARSVKLRMSVASHHTVTGIAELAACTLATRVSPRQKTLDRVYGSIEGIIF